MIEQPNSCGQGTDPTYVDHPLFPIVVKYGYTYSHSTPIVALDGTRMVLHTFTRAEHNVSFYADHPRAMWDTSTSCASGRQWSGIGSAELSAHLKSKARRYEALKVKVSR